MLASLLEENLRISWGSQKLWSVCANCVSRPWNLCRLPSMRSQKQFGGGDGNYVNKTLIKDSFGARNTWQLSRKAIKVTYWFSALPHHPSFFFEGMFPVPLPVMLNCRPRMSRIVCASFVHIYTGIIFVVHSSIYQICWGGLETWLSAISNWGLKVVYHVAVSSTSHSPQGPYVISTWSLKLLI